MKSVTRYGWKQILGSPIELWKQELAIMYPVYNINVLSMLSSFAMFWYQILPSPILYALTSGMILLDMATLFYTKGVIAWDNITFIRFMHYYKTRIFDAYIASYPGTSLSEYTSVNTLSSIDYTTCTTEFLI